ncbi:hypothetical protein EZS27_037315, partial [termite gut metagenome]
MTNARYVRKIHVLFFVFLLVSIVESKSQNSNQTSSYTVLGRVIDRLENTPVEFANIILYNTTDGSAAAGYTATRSDGTFVLECKKAGNYYLKISFLGYKTFETSPFHLSGEKKTLTIADVLLEQLQQELSEVEIVGQKRQVVYKLDKQVIEASGYISAAGGTAVDILAQTPSIRVDADG